MAKRKRPPSQGWRTFLRNHVDGIAPRDLCVVSHRPLPIALRIVDIATRPPSNLIAGGHGSPTAEWIVRQLTEAYGWTAAPRYIVRDRDAVYGDIFLRRLQAMGIPDRPT